MAREGGRENFGAAARDLGRLREQSRAMTRAAEAEAGVLVRSNRAMEEYVATRRRAAALRGVTQYDQPIGPSADRAMRELRDRAMYQRQALAQETRALQDELRKREGALKAAQTRMRKIQDDPMWGTPVSQQGAARQQRMERAQASIGRAAPRVDEARAAHQEAVARAQEAAARERQFRDRIRALRDQQGAAAVSGVSGTISPEARRVKNLLDAFTRASAHVREAAPVTFEPNHPTGKVARAGYSPAEHKIRFYHEPASVDEARNVLAHEAYHARTAKSIYQMTPQSQGRMGSQMEDLMERIRQRVVADVKGRLVAAGTPLQAGTKYSDIRQHISPAEFDMMTGRKQVEGYYKGPGVRELQAGGAATFKKGPAWAHEGGARIASFFEMHPDTFRQVASPAEVSWFERLMSGGHVAPFKRGQTGGGGQPPRPPRRTRAGGDAAPDEGDSGREGFRREAEEIRGLRQERERMAGDEARERAKQRQRGVTNPEADREARATEEARQAKEREQQTEREGRGDRRATRDEIERNTEAREAETRAVDRSTEAKEAHSRALVPRTPQAAGYGTRRELREAEARAGLRPGPQFGDYPTTAGPLPGARGTAGPAGPGDRDFERPIAPSVRDRFRADRDVNRSAATGMEEQRRAASGLTAEEERLKAALTAEERAQHEETYNRARRAIDGQAEAQKRAAGVTRLTAVEFGTASQAMRRHGALTSEWIAAAARGETTMRELGFQTTATIGKFAGWTAAASAVYGVLGAVHQLGTGAMATQGGVHQLTRVINNVNPAEAGRGFRDLAEEFNVPIDVAADAVYRMGQRFHSVPEAMEAARSALYSFKTGEVDVGTATQNLLAVVNGFGLSSSQLTDVYDKINQAQNQFGINIGETEAGLAKAAGTWRNAGGDLDYLLGLFVAISRQTGRSGQEIGTGLARAAVRIRTPEAKRRLSAQGVDVDPDNLQATIQAAMAAARRGADLQELSQGIMGNQYARLLTATLKDQQLLNEAVGPEFAKNAQGSAARELAKVLKQVDEQIRALGVGLQEIGAALADTHLLDPLGGMLRLLNLSLDAVRELLDAFNALPEPIRQAVAYMGEAAAFLAIMRRWGPTNMVGRFPALAPFVRDPNVQLQTQAKRGLRNQLDEVQNRRESLMRRRVGEAIDLEASRTALTQWDKKYASQMEAAPMYGTRRNMLAAQRVALEQQLQSAEAAHLRSLHETNAIKVAQIRAEEELAVVSRMRPGQVANYLRENRYPIPAEMFTPSARGARLVGSPYRSVSDNRFRDYRIDRRPQGPDSRYAQYMPGASRSTFVGVDGRWERELPPPTSVRTYNPRYSRGWTQAREAVRSGAQNLSRTTTEFLRNQSVTQRLLGPLSAMMITTGNATGYTGQGLRGLTRGGSRLRGGLQSMRTGLTAARTAAGNIASTVTGIIAGLGLFDGLLIAFAGFEIIKSMADKDKARIEDLNQRMKRIGTPGTRQELEEFRKLREQRIEDSWSDAGQSLSYGKFLVTHPIDAIFRGKQDPFTTAYQRRMQEDMESQAREQRDAALQRRDLAADRPVHHRLAPEILRDAKRASDEAVKGATSVAEFNAAIDQGVEELYRSRYIKPKDARSRRRELERIRRTTLGQLDPTNFAQRFDDAGLDELNQQFEISATQLARPGRRGDAFHMRELRAIFNRIVRRSQSANTPEEIKAALQAEEEMYKAIEAEMQSNLELDLGSARTEGARQRAFQQAIRFMGTMSRDARGRERASGERLKKANADVAKRQQQMDEAQANQGAIPDLSDPFAPGAVMRPIANVAKARQNLEEAKRKQREAREQHRKDAEGVKDAQARVRIARQELREQQYQDAEQGANIDRDLALSELSPTDKEGRRRIQLDYARRDLARAKRYKGPNRARKIKEAQTELNELENQQDSERSNELIENARALGAIREAQAGPDPIARAAAAVQTAREVLAATRQDPNASLADRRQAIAGLIQAEADQDDAIRQRAITIQELSFDIEAARAKGDPVAEAKAAQGKAALHRRTARTPEERQQALLEMIQANNQNEQALNDREQARFEFLESQTDDPVRQARLRQRAAHRAVGHTRRGTAEWYRARAQENQEKRNVVQERLNERRDDIDFNLEMDKITKDTAIAQYRSLLNTHGITKQARRDILRRIKQLQDESDQEASGFALDVGQIKLPTIYDVKRAFGPIRERAREMASPRFHSNIEVNVEVTDPGAAGQVYDAIDRALNTSVRAAARSAHMRG